MDLEGRPIDVKSPMRMGMMDLARNFALNDNLDDAAESLLSLAMILPQQLVDKHARAIRIFAPMIATASECKT